MVGRLRNVIFWGTNFEGAGMSKNESRILKGPAHQTPKIM